MNFYEFTIPTALNGTQLKTELNCDEVYIRGDKLVIGGDLTLAQAQAGVTAHVPKPTQAELDAITFTKDRADGLAKLEALGLTLAQASAVARKRP